MMNLSFTALCILYFAEVFMTFGTKHIHSVNILCCTINYSKYVLLSPKDIIFPKYIYFSMYTKSKSPLPLSCKK